MPCKPGVYVGRAAGGARSVAIRHAGCSLTWVCWDLVEPVRLTLLFTEDFSGIAGMKSKKSVHCWIVYVSEADAPPEEDRRALRDRPRFGRSVDPYVAGLIARLQAEVRRERQAGPGALPRIGRDRFHRLPQEERTEAEITWRDSPLHFTEADFDGWERGFALPGDR